MATLLNILTMLNVCSVQFYGGVFDSHTSSLRQSIVPAVIACNDVRHINISQKMLESIQPASLSQKCLNSAGTAIILFTSVNDRLTINTSAAVPLQNKPTTLNRYSYVLQLIATYSNPAFVFLQIEATVENYNFIFDWVKLPITSQLLLFDAENIYRPIIDHGPRARVTLDVRMILQPSSSPMYAIKSKSGIKLDLNGRYVLLSAGFPKRGGISDCSLNVDTLLTNPELCILHLLEKQINFTTIPFPESPKYFLLRLINVLAESFANNVVISKGIPGIQWLTHGVRFESYKLILIAKLQGINLDSLLQPFDMNIWMAFLVASCLFFTVVCVGSKFKEKGQLMLWMMSTLLSQTDEILTVNLFHKKRWINLSLVSSWLFLIFLLNVLYQGDLYSCLSNVRLPVLPNSLRETLITNTPLFTIGETCFYSQSDVGNRKCYSTLLSTLVPDILKIKEADEVLRKVALQVLNRTEYIPGDQVFIALEMASGSDKLRLLKKDWITPNSFGVLASSIEAEEFTAAANIVFKEYIIRQTTDINPFSTMKPWMSQRGPFAAAFSSGIGSLSQSGLLERWRKHFLSGKVMIIAKIKFKSMYDLENKLLDKESTLEEQLSRSVNRSYVWEGSGRLYSRIVLDPGAHAMPVSVQSVPFEVMVFPFLVCIFLISFSIVVLLMECVATKLRRSKINQTPVIKIITSLKVH
jgi:hypothetical protein